ncbi:MAG: hypothetical protein KC503_19430 [Myxococcales bacterium]|nr:hypothetical protein [Myxococcales bacterium]
MNPLAPADHQRLLAAVNERSDMRARQDLQWVCDLSRIASTIAQEGAETNADTLGMFWIRLHEVVGALHERNRALVEFFADERRTSLLLNFVRSIEQASRNTREALTTDELVWLDYARSFQSHIHQDGYELQRKKNGLREHRHIKIAGKSFQVDELRQILDAVRARYAYSETAITVDFAMRLSAPIRRLQELLEALHRLG